MTDEFDPIRDFYDSEYYARYVVGRELPWHSKAIARRLGDLTERRVLDVACGGGEWLDYLRRGGASVAGVDLSKKVIDVCRQQIPDGEFVCDPAEALPFADGRFDLVTCEGSLEHFIDKPRARAEMKCVARRDAKFLILVRNAGFLTRRLGLYRGTQQAKAREDVFDLETWAQLFERAGLQVIARWRDLHPLSWSWIARGNMFSWLVRGAQALALATWPMRWQYQVHHCCRAR